MKRFLAITVAAILSQAAMAGTWDEILDGGGDAGETLNTAQLTDGMGELNAIVGTIGADTDMYCIRITDVANFVALVSEPNMNGSQEFNGGEGGLSGDGLDSQLWLFDMNGNGIAFNDDDPQAGGFSLLSRLTGQFVPGPGLYFLAISKYDRDAFRSDELAIWNDSPFATERVPDGPGAPGPLGFFGPSPSNTSDQGYMIELNGASYHVPEPSALSLLCLGLLGVLRRR